MKLISDITEAVLNRFDSNKKFDKNYFMNSKTGKIVEVDADDEFSFRQFNPEFLFVADFNNSDKSIAEFEGEKTVENLKKYISNKIKRNATIWALTYSRINEDFKMSDL